MHPTAHSTKWHPDVYDPPTRVQWDNKLDSKLHLREMGQKSTLNSTISESRTPIKEPPEITSSHHTFRFRLTPTLCLNRTSPLSL